MAGIGHEDGHFKMKRIFKTCPIKSDYVMSRNIFVTVFKPEYFIL